MGPIGFPELITILVTLLVSFLFLGFWIWMLVDCIKNEPEEGNDKIIWILVIALTGWIGALIYFFARRPTRMQQFGR